MKKTHYIFGMLLCSLTILVGCNSLESTFDESSQTSTVENNNVIDIIMPQGTPLVGVGKLLDNPDYDFEIVSGPDALTAALTAKTHDIVIAPLTAGAKLFIKNASTYLLDSVITTNNTYIVSKNDNTLNSVSDLNGKEIIGYSQGNTPGIILEAALNHAGIDFTDKITYVTSVTEAIAQFTQGAEYIMCAEPQITKLKASNSNLHVLDLSAELDSDFIPQAAIFVNPESPYQDEIDNFIADVSSNITYLNAYPLIYASEIVSKNAFFSTLSEATIAASIPNSNIEYYKAKDNISVLSEYYSLLNEYNTNLLGGVPSETFYRQ